MKRKLLILAVIAMAFCGCYNDNEEDIYQYYTAGTGSAACDTGAVTYQKQMKNFFDSRCGSCHPGHNVDLSTFSAAHDYAVSNGSTLYNTVASGNHHGISLSDCEKTILQKWINNPVN